MRDQSRLRFGSTKSLGKFLGLTRDALVELAESAPRHYERFNIPKRGKPGLYRGIDKPSHDIKRVQKLIYKSFLRDFEFPSYLYGGIKGRSVHGNAVLHCDSHTVLTMDIREFYPSVSHKDVYEVWRSFGVSPDVARCLTQLTTLHGSLPQGAPTSTALSNLVLRPLDEQIIDSIGQCTYSRYIDDLCISGDFPQEYIPLIADVFREYGFSVSRKKTMIMKAGEQQLVTGLTVNGEQPSKTKSSRSKVRSAIHQLSEQGVFDGELSSIVGRINNIALSNPENSNQLFCMLADRLAELGYEPPTSWGT